jgi:hypothetical protein
MPRYCTGNISLYLYLNRGNLLSFLKNDTIIFLCGNRSLFLESVAKIMFFINAVNENILLKNSVNKMFPHD